MEEPCHLCLPFFSKAETGAAPCQVVIAGDAAAAAQVVRCGNICLVCHGA